MTRKESPVIIVTIDGDTYLSCPIPGQDYNRQSIIITPELAAWIRSACEDYIGDNFAASCRAAAQQSAPFARKIDG